MPQDIIKFCYQSAFGAEHMMSDAAAACAYFRREYDAVEPADILLAENISEEYCRVNFAAWKFAGLDPERLFSAFSASCEPSESGADAARKAFFALTDEALAYVRSEKSAGYIAELEKYLASYIADGLRPVHHSPEYAAVESPHYRLVKRKILFP